MKISGYAPEFNLQAANKIRRVSGDVAYCD